MLLGGHMGVHYIIPSISVLFEMSVIKSEKKKKKKNPNKKKAITDFLNILVLFYKVVFINHTR